MTRLERHSFYSFLSLYVISSFLLILLVGYWYFTSQKEMLKSQIHSKLEQIVNKERSAIVYAHMQNTRYSYSPPMGDVRLSLVDVSGEVIGGEAIENVSELKPGFFIVENMAMLVSDAPKGHLDIELIVAKTDMLYKEIADLAQRAIATMLSAMLVVFIVAWILSKIFMRPLRQRVSQIESFINDVTHELNTPITSLSMATKQAIDSGVCTDRMLKNIFISTKQLYEIYRSLTYLNLSDQEEAVYTIDVSQILQDSIAYYKPLAEIKKIDIRVDIEKTIYKIPSQQLSLLFGNLIGNAIKYSHARSTINITLKNNTFRIKDEGIGIAKNMQKEIFKKFTRGTKLSGGFGIGLNVVQSICDKYNIDIELNSSPKKGSEFILKFQGN